MLANAFLLQVRICHSLRRKGPQCCSKPAVLRQVRNLPLGTLKAFLLAGTTMTVIETIFPMFVAQPSQMAADLTRSKHSQWGRSLWAGRVLKLSKKRKSCKKLHVRKGI